MTILKSQLIYWKEMRIIKTSEYVKLSGSWDMLGNFWKSRDRGQQGHVLFESPELPETEDEIEKLWKPKHTKKNKNRSNA